MTIDRLLTIPVSHYCEKARWALDLAGVPYREDGWPPAVHRMALARYRTTTVPVLVCAEGPVLRQSTDIVRHAAAHAPQLGLMGQTPEQQREILELVARFDRDLGPATRLLVYAATIPDPARFMAAIGAGLTPGRRRLLARVRPAAALAVARVLGVDAAAAERAAATVDAELAFAQRRRGDSPYLVGDRFTAADLTFAALAAPVVLPDGYGGRALDGRLPDPGELPEIARWRQGPHGDVVCDLYRRHRV